MESVSSQVEHAPAAQVEFDGSLSTGPWGLGRRIGGLPILETRGPAASTLRDSLFRRLLFAGDVLAILGAFALAIELSGGRLHLIGVCLAGSAADRARREAVRSV